MRNLLDAASVAQCLDEEPSDGETACPHWRNLLPRPFSRKFLSTAGAARTQRRERDIVGLERERIAVKGAASCRDRDRKLLLVNEQRHDMTHQHRVDRDLRR